MLILLPPSEGKHAPGRGRPLDLSTLSYDALRGPRAAVLDALVELCDGPPAHAASVLGLGPTQAEEVRRNAALRESPTARADRIYSGVLYEALDLGSLTGAARGRATRWLAVTSALFGLVRPGDHIPAYRLSGDVSLPGVGPVASHWRGVLGPVLDPVADGGLVVDLRSSTYAAFWRPPGGLRDRVATVRVLHESGGRRTVVSHFNKATKGRVVRSLLLDGGRPQTPGALAEQLSDLGWRAEVPEAGRVDVVVDQV